MSEVTPAKRVLPARERRESAAKRYSPAPPIVTRRRTAAGKPATPSTPASEERSKRTYTKRPPRSPSPRVASTPPADDILPTKVASSKPLPVTRQKQASKLSSQEYQSIAESAILAASLHRSRAQWLSDAIFKKYWVKPFKRGGVVQQPPDNPDAKSMTKLGNGTISIEPHKLDVTFYTVRDQVPPTQFKQPTQSVPKASPAYPMAPPYTPYKPPVPNNSLVQASAPPASTQPIAGTKQQTPTSTPKSSTLATGTPPVQQTVQSSVPASKVNSDPVIQMLAARAASDPRLKDLMKVVATSKANSEQLKEFQKHIDEFNAVVKQQEADKAEKERQEKVEAARSNPPTPQQNVPGTGSTNATPTSTPGVSQAPVASPIGAPGGAHPSVYTTTAPRPPYAAPFTPPPPPARPAEAHIRHIVIEFNGDGASTDRFLFPAYAALDMKYGGLEMLASFFVVRKGSDIIASLGDNHVEDIAAAQPRWKADVEYYQSVTIMVRANQHRTIETIARAAKTLPEVREHMKQVVETKIRAPMEYLVHQLPREKGVSGADMPSTEMVDSGVEMGSDEDDAVDDDELKDTYGIL